MMQKKVAQPVTNGVARVSVTMQLEALECGAASLTMILAYYGKHIPLERVRKDCGVSRDGSNAKNLLKAARNYGLIASGHRFEPAALKQSGKFPCIIHWNFNHFVVLCGFKKDNAIINDPARGSCAVPMQEFDKAFTGICLMFEPGENFEPSGKPKSIWRFAKKKLRGTGAAFTLVVITTIVTSLIGIVTPGFASVFADHLLSGKNPEWFQPFIIAMALVVAIQIAITWIQQIYMLKAEGKIAVVSNSEYMWHVLRLPMEFFSQRMAGDILGRKAQNQHISNNMVQIFAPLAIQAVMLVFYVVLMLRYSVALTVVGILSILINLFVSRWISHKRMNLARVISRESGKLAGTTVAGIEMIETIKASGAENGFFQKWSGYQAGANAGRVEFTKVNARWGLIPSILSGTTNTLILMCSVWMCMHGDWTIGMITAFSGFLSAMMAPAEQMLSAAQAFQEMRNDMERIEDVLEYPADVELTDDASEPESYDKLSGRLELKNVTFGYSRLTPPLIENFSMTVKPGQRIAFVGPSGCGKSTLSKLISGLYKPWSGEILFDGKPLNEINRSVFSSSLAVVDQDVVLFEDTIAGNIRMWDTSIEDFEMILAARDAQIHDDIMQRDGGYQYKLAEGGKDLSGGQRQRLEIARVLAQDPTMIIMDEATSALDARTEFEVVNSINNRGITCIVVAHRLSTIRDCDEIIVFDRGKVVERGTHDELYARGGAYAQLVTHE